MGGQITLYSELVHIVCDCVNFVPHNNLHVEQHDIRHAPEHVVQVQAVFLGVISIAKVVEQDCDRNELD